MSQVPTADAVVAAAAVDVLHGASMAAAALFLPRFRTPALIALVTAAVSAVGGASIVAAASAGRRS